MGASVEIRDNPALEGKPLIIGSMPNERGVVATCNYCQTAHYERRKPQIIFDRFLSEAHADIGGRRIIAV